MDCQRFGRIAKVARWLAALLLAGCATAWAAAPAPKNIIILFADGAAPVQWEFGRYSSKVLRGQPFATTDVVFRDGVLGLLSTHPDGAQVTDSAAAASAMSTGHKVANGSVSVTPDGTPRRTVMQAAKAAGKRIGLVTTATVYDATPAAFSVNAQSRRDAPAIVDQYFALQPDVLMGGGADFFLPDDKPGGRRGDGQDLVAAFAAKGYAIVGDTTALRAARGPRLLGLFARGDMQLELDRDPAKEPSTADMTKAALELLSRDSPKGFVLLVENENTDTAGHLNDAASLMRALWAFDDAVKVALEFRKRHPDTLLIVTGDHETGGFSPTYALRSLGPSSDRRYLTPRDEQLRLLAGIRMSVGRAASLIGRPPSAKALDNVIAKGFPGFRLDADLRALVLERKTDERNFSYSPHNALGRMVARQTGYYWGTSGHTPEPVAVGALGPGSELFRGFQDNTEFGRHLHRLISGKSPRD